MKKCKELSDQIIGALEASKSDPSSLESMIGRTNHATFLMTMSRHYLNRLRNPHVLPKHRRFIHLTLEVMRYFHLKLSFLEKSSKGISINNAIERRPSYMFIE